LFTYLSVFNRSLHACVFSPWQSSSELGFAHLAYENVQKFYFLPSNGRFLHENFQNSVETLVYSMKFFQKCIETLVYSVFSVQKYVETVVYSMFCFQKYEETLVYLMFSKLLGLETVVFSHFSKLLAVEKPVYSMLRKLLAVATRLYSLLREFLAVAPRSVVSPAEAASHYDSTSGSYSHSAFNRKRLRKRGCLRRRAVL